jgi:hypothetical protein
MANGVAVDARKVSKVLQDLVLLAEKRYEKKKKAEDGVSKKASTNNKKMIMRSVDLNGSTSHTEMDSSWFLQRKGQAWVWLIY